MGGFAGGLLSGLVGGYGQALAKDEEREFQERKQKRDLTIQMLTSYLHDPETNPQGASLAAGMLGEVMGMPTTGRKGKRALAQFDPQAVMTKLWEMDRDRAIPPVPQPKSLEVGGQRLEMPEGNRFAAPGEPGEEWEYVTPRTTQVPSMQIQAPPDISSKGPLGPLGPRFSYRYGPGERLAIEDRAKVAGDIMRDQEQRKARLAMIPELESRMGRPLRSEEVYALVTGHPSATLFGAGERAESFGVLGEHVIGQFPVDMLGNPTNRQATYRIVKRRDGTAVGVEPVAPTGGGLQLDTLRDLATGEPVRVVLDAVTKVPLYAIGAAGSTVQNMQVTDGAGGTWAVPVNRNAPIPESLRQQLPPIPRLQTPGIGQPAPPGAAVQPSPPLASASPIVEEPPAAAEGPTPPAPGAKLIKPADQEETQAYAQAAMTGSLRGVIPAKLRGAVLKAVQKQGGLILSDKQREAWGALEEAKGHIQQLAAMAESLVQGEGPKARVGGLVQRGKAFVGMDAEAKTLEDLQAAILSSLARSVGRERGNLSEGDIRRARSLTFSLGITREELQRKLAAFTEIIERGQRITSEMAGRTFLRSGFNSGPEVQSTGGGALGPLPQVQSPILPPGWER